MATKRSWVLAKDINTKQDSKYWGRGGTSIRYIGKGTGSDKYKMYVEFNRVWDDMAKGVILQADLLLHTHEQGDWTVGSQAAIVCYALTQDFDNDAGDEWDHEAWESPKYGTTQVASKRSGIPTSHNQPFRIDVLKYIARIAPSSVNVQIGTVIKPGTGSKYPDHGLMLRSPDEGNHQYSLSIFSGDAAAPTNSRPTLEITWEPANVPPSAIWGAPLGPSSTDEEFRGTYFDADGDRISKAQVQVWRTTDNGPDDSGADSDVRWDSKEVPWTLSWPDGEYRIAAPEPPLSRKTQAGAIIEYEGRVRVWDTRDTKDPGPWTPTASGLFSVVTADPVVTRITVGTKDTLQTTIFQASWTFDPAAIRVASYRVQLTRRSDSGVWGSVLWDQMLPVTDAEQTDKKASFRYGGPALAAGDYSWRIKIWDELGSDSLWSQDDTLHLNQGTASSADPPDFSTVYGRGGITTRLVMRAVDTSSGANRKPGKVVAIIENPYNLGVTGNASSPGQLYFTLPNKHPQIAAMEPIRTHWSLQQYRGGEWKELTAGLLTDFDATEDDTIFNGLDYLGVLSLSIEAQAQPDGDNSKTMEAQFGKGGAKYVKKTISYVINHQLKRAIAAPDSPLGFFTIPSGGIDTMSESITIHSAYAQRLDFIRGLLDSHRGGATGRRSRIMAAANPISGVYEFTVRSNAGRDRPNLRFEYGGLVQGYRVMALGDWADKVYGVGRLRNELRPRYSTMAAPGIDVQDWGEIGRASVWQDISDVNDLTRKARSLATEMSRAGKRIALGLRTHAVALLDGWALCDNIRLDISHGSVDTMGYGTDGWWTIWGWEWRLYPDGHDELTFVVKPTEGVSEPVTDLIPSSPIHVQPEWTIAHGPPIPTNP